jgi:hypothetical protein
MQGGLETRTWLSHGLPLDDRLDIGEHGRWFLPRSAREAAAIDAIVLCGLMVQSGSPIVEKLGYLVELSLREAIQGGPYAFPINIIEGCIIPNIGYKGVVSE